MRSWQTLAEKALRDECLTREESLAVLQAPDDEVLGVLHAAFQVRRHHFGRRVKVQMLLNAKSGACQEDCHYCSQSSISTAPIERYGLLPLPVMLDGARRAAAARAQRYCIVTSGRGPLDRDIKEIAAAVRAIKAEIPIRICCSLGLINEAQAKELKAAGVDRINHNLNTSETHHGDICSTHTFQDRMTTIASIRAAGLELCSGGIIGMGERDEDLVDLAFALRNVRPHSLPVNMLTSIPGTPLEDRHDLSPRRCLKVLCLLRFLHPGTELRVAGGREVNLRSLQPLALYAADSLFVNGYLTTPGQPAAEAWRMIEDLGFEIEVVQEPAEAGINQERATLPPEPGRAPRTLPMAPCS